MRAIATLFVAVLLGACAAEDKADASSEQKKPAAEGPVNSCARRAVRSMTASRAVFPFPSLR